MNRNWIILIKTLAGEDIIEFFESEDAAREAFDKLSDESITNYSIDDVVLARVMAEFVYVQ